MRRAIYEDDVIKLLDKGWKSGVYPVASNIHALPSAQPDNQTNLCDSCDYSYPDCPSKNDDVIFGNGIGNDNICACNKYKPSVQPELTDGQAIEHLQESGWMQNHDKQMYEMGLREQLADDSDSYDALLPSAQQEPAIPLQWIEAQIEWLKSLDNTFSTLTAVQISAMVNKWKDEQDD